MTGPLSDVRLAEIRERVPSAACPAAHPGEVDKGHVWVIGSLSGALRCSACHLSQRALDSDEVVLLAEVDRLAAESEQRLGELLFWHFEFQDAMDNYRGEAQRVKKLAAESESRRQAAAANAESIEVLQRQINEQAGELDRLRTELAVEQAKVYSVQTVKCWVNEDGRRFVFAEDLAFALGYTPTTPAAPSA